VCFRYYLFLYSHWLGAGPHSLVAAAGTCDDLLLNMLVAHVTKLPPLKLAQRHTVREADLVTQADAGGRAGTLGNALGNPAGSAGNVSAPELSSTWFAKRQACLNEFAEYFGYMPLKRSNLRLDPILYRDPVSILRKKYRQIERT
jgi:glucuronyl/N-acetylglucosaminyl transferase EXT1